MGECLCDDGYVCKEHRRPVTLCRHCHQPVMEFEFKYGKEWWHANPERDRVTYRHCRNDVHAPLAEPEVTHA